MMRRMKTPESRIKLARMDPKQVADEIGDFIVRKVLEMKKILTPEQSAKMKSIMDAKKKEFDAKRKDKDGKDSPHDDF